MPKTLWQAIKCQSNSSPRNKYQFSFQLQPFRFLHFSIVRRCVPRDRLVSTKLVNKMNLFSNQSLSFQAVENLVQKLKQNDNLKAILLGQFLSVLIASTAICSTVLVNQGINIPTTQSFFNYLFLSITFGIWRIKSRAPLPPRWPLYALVSLLDVEGNFLLVKAYQYTSITSVTLLDCFSLPCVMILSYFVLQARYRLGHVVGGCLCVAGLALLIVMDHHEEAASSNPLLGDMLVIAGATVYGICNVTQERLLRSSTIQDFLLLIGLFGVVWSGAQASILERSEIVSALFSSSSAIFPLFGFSLSLFLFYCLVPFVLRWSGAAVLNLSLLSSDLWAALARMVFFGGFSAWSAGAFFTSLLLVTVGLIIYARNGDVYSGQKWTEYTQFESSIDGYSPKSEPGERELVGQSLQAQRCDMQKDNMI
eukprot:TRINITY_DN25456_c0_g2_i1.p1 TRINITY_DN25456_c0_g2~~TRINITY_DN25456_c0_g2_i1.p1  ORF type:complete len:452 (+),score=30.48 TRINITY_DN25456_c0_g2_i1:90-1358(+)